MRSGDLFNLEERSEYTETMIGQCIDEYTAARIRAAVDLSAAALIDVRMEDIVNRMFERCFRDAAWNQAVGVAIEARRLDVVEDAVARAGRGSAPSRELLRFVFDVAVRHVASRTYRREIFSTLARVRCMTVGGNPRPPAVCSHGVCYVSRSCTGSSHRSTTSL